MTLIVFLDKARLANIFERSPRLFAKDAAVKSSREVFVSLCRDFLSAEGDVMRHLTRLGLKVSYQQDAVDELDFAVENLAIDIRDGVRLARVVEILSKRKAKSLLLSLRLPAVSRLQKLHNVGVVLDSLRTFGVKNLDEVAAHHIVDGYREKVLQLLWAVVLRCGLNYVLSTDDIDREIERVEQSNKSRKMVWRLCEFNNAGPRDHSGAASQEDPNAFKKSLLRWCNAVCSSAGVRISDFGASMSDGVALCLLINYYHPSLVPLADILPTNRYGSVSRSSYRSSVATSISNERKNVALACRRMTELGGIPRIVGSFDSENPPDDKAMTLCLTYLCSRLMESSREILACIAIQLWYRQKTRIRLLELKLCAASCIWTCWARNRSAYYAARKAKYFRAVRTIERFVSQHQSRLQVLKLRRLVGEKRVGAAIVIQSQLRRVLALSKVDHLRYQNRSVGIIQRAVRSMLARHFVRIVRAQHKASVIIQTKWRSWQHRRAFKATVDRMVVLQAVARGWRARRQQRTKHYAAVVIQALWRGFSAQVEYALDVLDIVAIQTLFRRKIAVKRANARYCAVIKLQSFVRRVLAVEAVDQLRNQHRVRVARECASIVCQRFARVVVAKRVVRMLTVQRNMAMTIQRFWRRAIAESTFKLKRKSCVFLQSAVRGYLGRDAYRTTRQNVISLQACYRRTSCRRRYERIVAATVSIQREVRGYFARQLLTRAIVSAISIQTAYRVYRARQRLAILSAKKKMAAAILAQSAIRRFLAQRRCVRAREVRKATICLQSWWRSQSTRNSFMESRRAAVLLQSRFRLHLCLLRNIQRFAAAKLIQSVIRRYIVKTATQLRLSATCIQARWKCYAAAQQFKKMQLSAVLIQSKQRCMVQRRHFEGQRQATIRIQATWRQYVQALQFHCTLIDIIISQSCVRRHQAACLAERRRLAIVVLQKNFRRWAAMESFRAMMRQWKEECLKASSATIIQASCLCRF